MEKYLIVLDLDDTILTSDKVISECSKSTLKECQNLGCKIVVNTARSYIRTVEYAKQINADYICCFNGNYVLDRNENIIYCNPIPTEVSQSIIADIGKCTDHIISEGLYSSFCSNKQDVDFVDSRFASLEFVKILQSFKLILRCKAEEFSYIRSLVEKYNLSINFSREKNVARILPKDSDKWKGIEKIKSFLNNEYKVIAFGDDISDLSTLKNADIGVRMQNSISEIIENIDFYTDSNNNDGVAKFLCNYFNLENNKTNYSNVKILDCSLRDGGHLNKSRFGYETIRNFIKKLVSAQIDIVEMGFLQDGEFDIDSALYPTVQDAEDVIKDIECENSIISLLAQVDKFDLSKLEPCSGKIKMIRVSFHKNYMDWGIQFCEEVKRKGYLCSVNPINFSEYSKEEVIELVSKVNRLNPDIFSIVDTFGDLLNIDFRNKLNLLNHLLNKQIQLGVHLHENLYMAFSFAQTIIENNSFEGNVIIDTSVAGLGRAPGNLRTETIAYFINKVSGKRRYFLDEIYSLMENEIISLKEDLDWENKFAYEISAFEKAHRSYAEYLLEKDIPLKDIEKLISLIPENKRDRFDESLIEKLYKEYLC